MLPRRILADIPLQLYQCFSGELIPASALCMQAASTRRLVSTVCDQQG